MCSISYLKFINKVFKVDMPQMLLSKHWQMNMNKSFLEELLHVFFGSLVKEFSRFEFASVGHFAKMAKRILKIIHSLLSRFDAGNSPTARVELKQPCPRFDALLNLCFKALSQIPFYIISGMIELQELTGFARHYNNVRQNFIHNKFLAKLIQSINMNSASGHMQSFSAASSHEKRAINQMVTESLRCLTTLTKLATQAEIVN